MEKELYDLHLEAGRKSGEEKTCGKKVRYVSEDKATIASENHNKWGKRRHDVEPYPCAFCKQWHIGNKMPIEILKQISGN